jgi:hypothetical protein
MLNESSSGNHSDLDISQYDESPNALKNEITKKDSSNLKTEKS